LLKKPLRASFREKRGIDCSQKANKYDVFSERHCPIGRPEGLNQQAPKTKNAIREIDLHPSLAEMLRQFIGDRKSGFLFQNRAGKFLCQTNTLRRSLHPVLKEVGAVKGGFHAFRRFRVTQLRRMHTPGDLIQFWLGHAKQTVTDVYSKLDEDVEFRKEWAEKAGLGFKIEVLGADVAPKRFICTQNQESSVAA